MTATYGHRKFLKIAQVTCLTLDHAIRITFDASEAANVQVTESVHTIDAKEQRLLVRKFSSTVLNATPGIYCTMQSQKFGATSSKDTRKNQKAFQEAVNNRDRQEVHRLLSIGVDINALNEAGDTPLHQCIRDGRIESAKLLVEFGADIRRTNRDGWSPVHLATFLGQRELMVYLLDK